MPCRVGSAWIQIGILVSLIACGEAKDTPAAPCEARSPCAIDEQLVEGSCEALPLQRATCVSTAACGGANFTCEDGACVPVDAPGRVVTPDGQWRVVVTDYSPPPRRCMLPPTTREIALHEADDRFDVLDEEGRIQVGRKPEPTRYIVDLSDGEHTVVFRNNTSAEGTLRGPAGEARTTWLRVDLPPAPMPGALWVDGTESVAQFRYAHPELEMWLFGERYVGQRAEDRAAMFNYETQTSAHLHHLSERGAMLVLRRAAPDGGASEELVLRLVDDAEALGDALVPGPTVVSTSPPTDELIRFAFERFTFRFDRPLDPDTVASDTFIVERLPPPGVQGVTPEPVLGNWIVQGNDAEFAPSRLMPFGARIRFTATDGIRGMEGLTLHGERSWTWTTGIHFAEQEVELWDADHGAVWVTYASPNDEARWIERVPAGELTDVKPGASRFVLGGGRWGISVYQEFEDRDWMLTFVGPENLGVMEEQYIRNGAPSVVLEPFVHVDPAPPRDVPEGWLLSPWTFALTSTWDDRSQAVHPADDGRIRLADPSNGPPMRVQLALPPVDATR